MNTTKKIIGFCILLFYIVSNHVCFARENVAGVLKSESGIIGNVSAEESVLFEQYLNDVWKYHSGKVALSYWNIEYQVDEEVKRYKFSSKGDHVKVENDKGQSWMLTAQSSEKLMALVHNVILSPPQETFRISEITPQNKNVLEEGIYLRTRKAVPENVLDYAKSLFPSAIGFEEKPLYLAPAFSAVPYEIGTSYDNLVYYFSVINETTIVDSLSVFDAGNGKYGTYYHGVLVESKNLAKLEATEENPVGIIVSDNAFYAIDNKNVFIVRKFIPRSDSEIEKEFQELNEHRQMYLDRFDDVVCISKDTIIL